MWGTLRAWENKKYIESREYTTISVKQSRLHGGLSREPLGKGSDNSNYTLSFHLKTLNKVKN